MNVEEAALVCCKCDRVGRSARVRGSEKVVPLGEAGDSGGVNDGLFYCYCPSHVELDVE